MSLKGWFFRVARSRCLDELSRGCRRARTPFSSLGWDDGEEEHLPFEAIIDPESGSVVGQMRLAYTNTTGETLTDLAFRLFPNAETIYGGGSLSVAGVEQAGTVLESKPSEDGTILHVRLARPLAPGGTAGLDLAFNAQVPSQTSQGYGVFNRALGVLCLAGWYPVLAAYGDDGWDTPPVPASFCE